MASLRSIEKTFYREHILCRTHSMYNTFIEAWRRFVLCHVLANTFCKEHILWRTHSMENTCNSEHIQWKTHFVENKFLENTFYRERLENTFCRRFFLWHCPGSFLMCVMCYKCQICACVRGVGGGRERERERERKNIFLRNITHTHMA
jgi:hypothetical protein